MFDPIITILIFIAVIAITAVLFGGWLIFVIVSAIGRLLLFPFRAKPQPAMLSSPAMTTGRCANDRCRTENPAVASFCRRCGAPMRPAQHVPVRRVAMW